MITGLMMLMHCNGGDGVDDGKVLLILSGMNLRLVGWADGLGKTVSDLCILVLSIEAAARMNGRTCAYRASVRTHDSQRLSRTSAFESKLKKLIIILKLPSSVCVCVCSMF